MNKNYLALSSYLTKDVWTQALLSGKFFNFAILLLTCLVGATAGLLCLISPLVAAILILGIFVIVASLTKPIILCYLTIVMISLTSGIERGRIIPYLSLNEVGLLLSVSIAYLVALVSKRRQPVMPGYFYAILIVLIGGVVIIPVGAFLSQGVQLTISNAFKMAAPIQYFLLFWLFATLPQGESDRHKLIGWMIACASVAAIVGILQALGIGFVTRILENWYASGQEAMSVRAGRVTSLLGAWNSLGIFLMFNFLIGWAILPEIHRSISRTGVITLMALSAVCLVATGSYAGILGLIGGIFILEAMARHRLRAVPILILCSAGVGLAILLFQPYLQPLVDKRLYYQYRYGGMVPQTLQFRFEVWREIFLPAIRQHFPWAVYPTVPSYFAWQNEESQYILLLFRTGLSGLLGYLGWVGITIYWLYRSYRRSSGFTSLITAAALALIILQTVAGWTNEVFSFAGSADYLWILLALVANSVAR